VGVLLVGFGTFWAGEGVGIKWPGTDAAILLLLAAYLLVALAGVRLVATRMAARRGGRAVEAAQ
jgi:Ca2+/H+ antiporter, TMEM165/GDT1 family